MKKTSKGRALGLSLLVAMFLALSVTPVVAQEPVRPADLGVAYLNIDPAQVLPNQEVIISANVCNRGGEVGAMTVSLIVSGEFVESQAVSVSPGACREVSFTVSRLVPGTYQVNVEGMTGQFSVLASPTYIREVPSQVDTGIGTVGIIAIIAVVIVLIAALVMIFRTS